MRKIPPPKRHETVTQNKSGFSERMRRQYDTSIIVYHFRLSMNI